MNKTVLIPLPDNDFELTEVSIPWKNFVDNNIEVTFSTENVKSIIHQRKVTALIKFLEKLAYYLTFWKLGNHFRTYPEYVEDEIKNNLENKNNFLTGGNPWKPFFVEDKNLITAR